MVPATCASAPPPSPLLVSLFPFLSFFPLFVSTRARARARARAYSRAQVSMGRFSDPGFNRPAAVPKSTGAPGARNYVGFGNAVVWRGRRKRRTQPRAAVRHRLGTLPTHTISGRMHSGTVQALQGVRLRGVACRNACAGEAHVDVRLRGGAGAAISCARRRPSTPGCISLGADGPPLCGKFSPHQPCKRCRSLGERQPSCFLVSTWLAALMVPAMVRRRSVPQQAAQTGDGWAPTHATVPCANGVSADPFFTPCAS